MKSNIFLIVFLFIGVILYGQNTPVTISTKLVEVKSKNLLNEIDSVLKFERKCTYFNDSTMFGIYIRNKNDYKEISIVACNDFALSNNDCIFIYKNHIFQIFSDSTNLDITLYTLTRYYMYFTVDFLVYFDVRGNIRNGTSVYEYEFRNNALLKKDSYICE